MARGYVTVYEVEGLMVAFRELERRAALHAYLYQDFLRPGIAAVLEYEATDGSYADTNVGDMQNLVDAVRDALAAGVRTADATLMEFAASGEAERWFPDPMSSWPSWAHLTSQMDPSLTLGEFLSLWAEARIASHGEYVVQA